MTISKDRVKPSPVPDSWKLSEIFATGIVLGAYLALMTAIFFWVAHDTRFFPVNFLFSAQRLNLVKHRFICVVKKKLVSACRNIFGCRTTLEATSITQQIRLKPNHLTRECLQLSIFKSAPSARP